MRAEFLVGNFLVGIFEGYAPGGYEHEPSDRAFEVTGVRRSHASRAEQLCAKWVSLATTYLVLALLRD